MLSGRLGCAILYVMARQEKLQALVLSRRSVGEADRLVTIFTQEKGLLRVLAKGVRKIPSRRGGHLEPLTRVIALVSGSQGRFFMAAVETQDYFPLLHGDREAFASAHVLARTLVALFEREVAYPQVYEAVRRAWELLGQLEANRRSLLEVATVALLLREAGVMPLLDKCQQCGIAQPREAVVLDPERGGWMCLTCLPTSPAGNRLLSPQGLKCLRYLAVKQQHALRLKVADHESRQLGRAVGSYIGMVQNLGVA